MIGTGEGVDEHSDEKDIERNNDEGFLSLPSDTAGNLEMLLYCSESCSVSVE